jgi:uncharacterized protein YcbK (DUF882 family)
MHFSAIQKEISQNFPPDRMNVGPPPGGSILVWSFTLQFVRSGLCLFLLLAVGFGAPVSRAIAADAPSSDTPYHLHFFHTHTGERLDIVYRHGDAYDTDALVRLNQYLRDHRTGDVHDYDPRVFDLLHDLTAALGRPDAEIDVVCGYRTPWSNEYLRSHGHGVAQHSLHMQAMAIDIRIPGVSTSELRDTALSLHRGGVGYYAASSFVHVDVGRVRRW